MKKSGSKSSVPPPAHSDPNLIVTRGLREILEKDLEKKKAANRGGITVGRPPKSVLCYLCGKAFFTKSISIHRPQCYLKQLIAWERGERRERPNDPETHEKEVQAQMDAIRTRDTVPAKANRMQGKDATKYTDEDWDMYNQIQQTTAFSSCPHCGRTFLPDRLEVHLRSCRPGHTAKPVRGKALPKEEGEVDDIPSPTASQTTAAPAAEASGTAANKRAPPTAASKPKATPAKATGKKSAAAKSKASAANNGGEEEEGEEVIFVSGGSGAVLTGRRSTSEANASSAPSSLNASDGPSLSSTKVKATPQPEEEEVELIACEKGEVKDNRLIHFTSIVKDTPDSAPEPSRPKKPVVRYIEPVEEPEVETVELEDGEYATSPTGGGTSEKRPAKKVQFNNISHFKEVKSRLQLNKGGPGAAAPLAGAGVPDSSLCPCSYCNRTFAPDRIEKHESCCLERKRPSKQSAVPPAKAGASTPRSGGGVKAPVPVRTNTATALRRKAAVEKPVIFCSDCGAKLLKEGALFCNACGMRTT